MQQSAEKTRKGAARQVTAILGDCGDNSIAIGSRKSNVCIRIYQKKNSEGIDGTRAELEFKGNEAHILFQQIALQSMLHPVLHSRFYKAICSLNCRPEILEKHLNILRDYEVIQGDDELPLVIKRSRNPQGKIVWFDKVVPKAAKLLLENPFTRDRLLL